MSMKSEDILLSIVIASRNYGRFIGDAIRSVLSQRVDWHYELIIVDGLSTDETIDVVRELAGEEIQITTASDCNGLHQWHKCERLTWVSEKDNGQSDAFNKGFSVARGRFLTWLNADDIFVRGAFDAFYKVVQRYPQQDWFAGSCLYADERLRIKDYFRCHKFSWLRARFGRFSVGGPSSFFSKRVYIQAGRIDNDLHFCMDADLWWKFVKVIGLRYKRIDYPIFVFRVHADSKVSGLDVATTERNLQNRKRQMDEGELLRERYNLGSKRLSQLVNILSFSIRDRIVSLIRTRNIRGMDAREI